jgi:hypothetical protein
VPSMNTSAVGQQSNNSLQRRSLHRRRRRRICHHHPHHNCSSRSIIASHCGTGRRGESIPNQWISALPFALSTSTISTEVMRRVAVGPAPATPPSSDERTP